MLVTEVDVTDESVAWTVELTTPAAACVVDHTLRIVLWSRGMADATTLELLGHARPLASLPFVSRAHEQHACEAVAATLAGGGAAGAGTSHIQQVELHLRTSHGSRVLLLLTCTRVDGPSPGAPPGEAISSNSSSALSAASMTASRSLTSSWTEPLTEPSRRAALILATANSTRTMGFLARAFVFASPQLASALSSWEFTLRLSWTWMATRM